MELSDIVLIFFIFGLAIYFFHGSFDNFMIYIFTLNGSGFNSFIETIEGFIGMKIVTY